MDVFFPFIPVLWFMMIAAKIACLSQCIIKLLTPLENGMLIT